MKIYLAILAVVCGLIANSVQAEVVTIDVTIKAVDAEEQVLTVVTKTKELKLEVAKKADIVVGGKATTLKRIVPGQAATISYESMLDIVTKIELKANSSKLLEQLQGTWFMISEERDGKKKTFEEIKEKEVALNIVGDLFSLRTTSIEITGKLVLADDEAPNAIDFDGKFIAGGKGKAVLLKGIAEVDEQTLQLCYTLNMDGGATYARPKSFTTKSGTPAPLSMVFKKDE